MKKLIMILTCIIASVGLSVAQTTRVSGTILDDTGETVIGASVVAKGTTVGTVTDIDGNFSLNIPSDKKTLVISLIGMKTKEVPAGTNLRIVMESDSKLMDEVVVTAMGISKEKKALGYAAQGVSSENLTQAANSSLSGALQGKVSGVQITPSSGMPGASSQITIRGSRSFTGNNTPLYVIDGMPIESTADISTGNSVTGTDIANRGVDIDPNDVASIDILKGQAASALYGIRASNGVVVITTKSGKGAAKGKPVISYSSSVSMDKVSRKPEYQSTYAQGTWDSKVGAYTYNPTTSMSWGPKISELPNSLAYGGNTKNTYTKDGAELHPGQYYVPQLASAGLDPWATPAAYDNFGDFFNTGTTWNNSVNVTQALDKTSYSVSLGSTTQDGIVPETGMDRYTAKITAETKLTSQWTTGFTGNYVNSSIRKAPTANNGVLATIYGAPPSYNYKGIPDHVANNPYAQVHYRGGSFENAYWGMDNNVFTEKNARFFGNAYVEYATKLNSTDKNLKLKYQIGTDSYTTIYSNSWGYGSRNYPTGQITNYSWTNGTFNSLLHANFDWKINDDFRFSAMLGNEVVHQNTKYLYEYGSNYNFPGWNNIGNATTQSNETEYLSKRTVGFFGSASLNYRSMLYLDVTGRQDYVSNMPRNNRSFFYPSVGASFIVSELDGVKNDVLSYLKVRASYAEVGQAADEYLANYFYKPSYGGGFYSGEPIKYPIGGISSYVPYYKVYDPKLKPQNTQSYELGADMNLWNGLIELNLTYSRQNVKDQIFEVPLAASTGTQSMITNAGQLHTNAYEITLNVNPVRTKNIDWSIGFNWSKIDNFVDELAPNVESIMLGGFVTPQVRISEGDKFPVIYGSDYARDKQGRILVDEDGLPMAGEATVIGKVSPDFILGINTSLRIQKLRLAAVLEWKSGGQMYHGTNGLLDLYGVSKRTENRDKPFVFDGWKEDGTKNDIVIQPEDIQYYYATAQSIDAYSVYNNSFLKIRELSASYPVYHNSWIDVTVNAFARNILLWTELSNFDPEASQGNNNMAGAFERFSLPQTSSYGLGVNVKF